MHFPTALATVVAIAPLVSAHAGPSLPKIVGLNPRDVKARNLLSNLGARFAEAHEYAKEETRSVEARANGQCGVGVGSCAAGECCSQSGYCGTTADFCYSPGCNYAYGPGCPDNAIPTGTNTSTIARTKLGSVAYGGDGIYNCVTAGTIALTYDDGPQKTYTAHILDLLDTYSAKATFFITGNNINKGQIDLTQEYIDVIKRMDASGHQIASHTWTHLDMSAVNTYDRKEQMWKNEMALRNIVGKIPTYMRPPYSSCTGTCETDMADLGYHVIYFDVDTDDYNEDSPLLIQKSKDWFKGNITANGATAAGGSKWLDIQHDIHEQTANNLTEYMLQTLTTLGYKAVTVGECLGDPAANWYRSASGAVSATASTSTATGTASKASSAATSTATKTVSTDATCGGTAGYTCSGSTFGNCCSTSGWCGSTTDYCGTGCQSAYGSCGTSSGTSAVASSTKAASSASKAASTVQSSAAASASASAKVSTDGTCSGTSGYTCTGSTYGNCCSSYGWCGSTTDHCGTGCNSVFGTCTSSASSVAKAATSTVKAASSTVKTSSTKVASAAAVSTKKASTDGTCAGTSAYTCTGSTYGNCCSQYGWCGSTTAHCSTGCQSTFGTCT